MEFEKDNVITWINPRTGNKSRGFIYDIVKDCLEVVIEDPPFIRELYDRKIPFQSIIVDRANFIGNEQGDVVQLRQGDIRKNSIDQRLYDAIGTREFITVFIKRNNIDCRRYMVFVIDSEDYAAGDIISLDPDEVDELQLIPQAPAAKRKLSPKKKTPILVDLTQEKSPEKKKADKRQSPFRGAQDVMEISPRGAAPSGKRQVSPMKPTFGGEEEEEEEEEEPPRGAALKKKKPIYHRFAHATAKEALDEMTRILADNDNPLKESVELYKTEWRRRRANWASGWTVLKTEIRTPTGRIVKSLKKTWGSKSALADAILNKIEDVHEVGADEFDPAEEPPVVEERKPRKKKKKEIPTPIPVEEEEDEMPLRGAGEYDALAMYRTDGIKRTLSLNFLETLDDAALMSLLVDAAEETNPGRDFPSRNDKIKRLLMVWTPDDVMGLSERELEKVLTSYRRTTTMSQQQAVNYLFGRIKIREEKDEEEEDTRDPKKRYLQSECAMCKKQMVSIKCSVCNAPFCGTVCGETHIDINTH